MLRVFAVSACLVVTAAAAVAQDTADAERKLMNKLMQQAEIISIMDVKSADAFVADKDPNTLQVVFLTGPEAGKAHVSQDGEVVFTFRELSTNDQAALTQLAFERKAKRILATQ